METWCGGEAGVAQLVEQLTCNQQVGGSIPFASSLRRQDAERRRETSAPARRSASEEGRYPSGQREQTVNLSASAFGGSNPPLPTQPREAGCATQGRFQGPRLRWFWFGDGTVKSASLLGPGWRACAALRKRGCAGIAQLVEHILGKDEVIGSIPIASSREAEDAGHSPERAHETNTDNGIHL